jgi:hypothetical protein
MKTGNQHVVMQNIPNLLIAICVLYVLVHGEEKPQVNIFKTKEAPFVSFEYLNFKGWNTQIREENREIRYLPQSGDAPKFEYPPSIQVSGMIKHDRSIEWIKEWKAKAKRNKQGIEIVKTYKKGLEKYIFEVDYKGIFFEITLEDWDGWGFKGKDLTQQIFETLQVIVFKE